MDDEQEVDGRVWRKVRDPDRNEGWVAAEFVASGSQSAGASPGTPAAAPPAPPAAVRATPLTPVPTAAASARAQPEGPACPESHPLKGVTNERGEKLYYAPSSAGYGSVPPEVCFSNGGEARGAGYQGPTP